MTDFTWAVRGLYASGLSADPAANTAVILRWGSNPIYASESVPWADTPAYPALLLTGVGFTLVTSGVAGNRRPSLTVSWPSGQFEWLAGTTQAATQTRRWELAPGFALDTTLAGTTFREPLPHGLVLLPGSLALAETQLTVSWTGAQAGDDLGQVTVRGYLLRP